MRPTSRPGRPPAGFAGLESLAAALFLCAALLALAPLAAAIRGSAASAAAELSGRMASADAGAEALAGR